MPVNKTKKTSQRPKALRKRSKANVRRKPTQGLGTAAYVSAHNDGKDEKEILNGMNRRPVSSDDLPSSLHCPLLARLSLQMCAAVGGTPLSWILLSSVSDVRRPRS